MKKSKMDLQAEVTALRMILFAAIEADGSGRKKYLKRLRAMLNEPNCITVGGLDTRTIRAAAAGIVRDEIAENEPIRRRTQLPAALRAGHRGR
jgi:hypothetical protein